MDSLRKRVCKRGRWESGVRYGVREVGDGVYVVSVVNARERIRSRLVRRRMSRGLCSMWSVSQTMKVECYCVSHQQRETLISGIGFLVLIAVVWG